MADLPFLQFYPADWLQDTRVLSLSAKGAWIDLLCAMWTARERGRIRMRLSAYGRLIGATDERTAQILDEITDLGIAEREDGDDGTISLWCRRMLREGGELEAQAAQRKQNAANAARSRWAKQRQCEPDAQGMHGACGPQCEADAIPDTRSQNEGRERAREPAATPELARRIVEAYPRREKLAEALTMVLRQLQDGEDFEAMLSGTRAAAAVIRTLPSGAQNRYVPSAEAFFRTKRWQDDPETLRRQGDTRSGSAPMDRSEALKQLGGRAAYLDEDEP